MGWVYFFHLEIKLGNRRQVYKIINIMVYMGREGFFPFPTILELPLQLNPGRIRPNTKWSTFHFHSHHVFELWNLLPSEIAMANFNYLKRYWTNSCSIYDIYSWNEGLLDAFKKAFVVTNGSHKWRSQLRIKTQQRLKAAIK